MESKRKNRDFNPSDCGVTHFLNRIGGKWKVLVIHAISKKYNRFSLMHRVIPGISKQMLVNQLRELEADGILERIIYAEIPPRVEYKITKYGHSLMPIISVIQEWGLKDLKKMKK
ncbi:MAG: HxlR family transcriptional regulator [Chitinophagaceae bacterium]|nr:HxlR family transcriptional regulator [Chitinophagaceae bacterium]